ncbi:hypothetical protein [Haliangium sp.]|uniref:hypothetical protein n=1 Tax=Haliangium sp. TaxID=2663208 RepID=UPI003D0C03E8
MRALLSTGVVAAVFAACARPAVSPAPAVQPQPPAASEPEAITAPPVTLADDDRGRLCRPGSPAHTQAGEDLAALDARIEALGPGDDPAPVLDALDALASSRCLQLADAPVWTGVRPITAASLRAFWDDGGTYWLGWPLRVFEERSYVTPPTMRRGLPADHPLACAPGDDACGARTRGWRTRAEDTLYRLSALRRLGDMSDDEPLHPTKAGCEADAEQAQPGERLTHWLACMEQVPLRYTALPTGATRAPERGWLLIRGRRGHYRFCDEVRAYDLATGSALVAQSCSGLVLGSDGVVDGHETDARRHGPTVQQGMIPLDPVREAAWMTLLASHAQTNVAEVESYQLPAWLSPEDALIDLDGGSLTGHGGGSAMFSSNQTLLSWSYMVDGEAVASGELTWPADYNDQAKRYAVELIALAESRLTMGCAEALPPQPLDFGLHRPAVAALDADEASLSRTERTLLAAMVATRLRPCARP